MKKRKNKSDFLKKYIHHKPATVSSVILIIEIISVILLPILLNLDPYTSDPLAFNAPPGGNHILGTDDVGRDILARLLYGGRNSLAIGVLSTAVSILIGLPLGLLAGYYRGAWEAVIMRAADIFMSFPTMILILVVVAIFDSSVPTIVLVIGVLGWPAIGKLIYGNVLSVRQKDYVEAARAMGTREPEIIFRYILPKSIAPLWMSVAFRISSAMITESGLSFLGCGVKSPQASWGNIIQSASNYMILTMRPWMWIPAGVCLMLTIVCINFVGEGIRDALDPKLKRL